MKTQISRDTFQPSRHYSAVYLQQGRMILDADWNELSDIQKTALESSLRDVITSGAPSVGGLAVIADPPGSTTLRIRPGALYVDGVPARLDAPAPLAISAQPDYPIGVVDSGQSLKLYADVWERTVTALQDPALMDAALHGADTATRTQTMLQVKWCPDTLDPLNEVTNPTLGTALLSLKLRLIASGGDKCDPCASQVKVDERLGNYLFRVEVHDFDPVGQWLTLKWSRDNGAEACKPAEMPVGFNQGPWVWEFFDDTTERLLGNHFVGTPPKLRGLIQETTVVPVGANDPKQYVRQWDGYLRIKLDTGILAAGRDRGVALALGLEASESHGRVHLAAGRLKINMELLELTLETAGRQFVPGDFWQAQVREASNASGDIVLSAAAPRGVRHHYLLLGVVGVDRRLVPQGDAFARRMAFPSLTNLTADKVGLTNSCAKLYGTAVNVQQALDNLCAIDATDIAYTLPGCVGNTLRGLLGFLPADDDVAAVLDKVLCKHDATNLPYAVPTCGTGPTVRSLLGLTAGAGQVAPVLDALMCGLNAGTLPYTIPDCGTGASVRGLLGLTAGGNQVAPVLDALMCGLKADVLPLDKTDTSLCPDLQAASVVTVQDALRVLCARSGEGCAIVVSTPEMLTALLTEFAGSSTATDLWLCLKPGTYLLPDIPPIAGKRSLRICAEGPESVSIQYSGTVLSIEASEVLLSDFRFTFSRRDGHMVIRATESRTRGCRFSRTSMLSNGPSMISVGGRGTGSCRMDWSGNSLTAEIRIPVGTGGDRFAGVNAVGDARLSGALLALGEQNLLEDKTAFDKAILVAAQQIVDFPKGRRLEWKNNLDRVMTPRAFWRVSKAGAVTISGLLNADTITLSEAVTAVEDLVTQWMLQSPDYALRLESVRVGGSISGNEIDGWLLFANGIEGFQVPGVEFVHKGLSDSADSVLGGGGQLNLEFNQITAIRANLPNGAISVEGELIRAVPGHARVMLVGNSLADSGISLTAASLVAQANAWFLEPGHRTNIPTVGSLVANRVAFSGNLLEGFAGQAFVYCTASPARRSSTGNVLVDLSGP
jgi:hypothetical protein